jgi:predicted O-methyltransferase YrrM
MPPESRAKSTPAPHRSRSTALAIRFAQTAASALKLFTFGMLTSRGRQRIGELSRMFGHTGVPLPELPAVSLDTLCDMKAPVTLRDTDEKLGNVTLAELLAIARIVRTRKPRVLFEIGTFDGRTTLTMASNAPDDAVIHTLDLPPAEEASTAWALDPAERQYVRKPASGVRVHSTDLAHKVRQHFGDSAKFDWTPFGRDGVDFVFVDGSHAYEYAYADSLSAMSVLRGGHGTILWHDYNAWRGVSDALHHLHRTDERFAGLRWISGTSLVILER